MPAPETLFTPHQRQTFANALVLAGFKNPVEFFSWHTVKEHEELENDDGIIIVLTDILKFRSNQAFYFQVTDEPNSAAYWYPSLGESVPFRTSDFEKIMDKFGKWAARIYLENQALDPWAEADRIEKGLFGRSSG